MKSSTIPLALLIACSVVAFPQTPMTNASVIDMVRAGLSEPVILQTIAQQRSDYKLSSDDLIALKAAGVTDPVLTAMLNRMKAQSGESSVKAPAPPAAGTAGTREAHFKKTKLADVKGKEASIDLILSDPKQSMVVNTAGIAQSQRFLTPQLISFHTNTEASPH